MGKLQLLPVLGHARVRGDRRAVRVRPSIVQEAQHRQRQERRHPRMRRVTGASICGPGRNFDLLGQVSRRIDGHSQEEDKG